MSTTTETRIRALYAQKLQTVVDEIKQGLWVRIDLAQVGRDLDADMHRELRETRERAAAAKESSPPTPTTTTTTTTSSSSSSSSSAGESFGGTQRTDASKYENRPLPPIPGMMSREEQDVYDGKVEWAERKIVGAVAVSWGRGRRT